MTDLKEKEVRDETIDLAEKLILENGNSIPLPLKHTFSNGLYIREIFVPAGTLLTTSIHKKEHPFVISSGKCKIYDGDNILCLSAPHTGITEANTRRIIYVEEDTTWTTFHVTNKTDVSEIEKEILIEHKNEYADQVLLEKAKKNIRSINFYEEEKILTGGESCHS
tara:strand:- start:897 stop:1394 length:498 start_codon:yes stop_codon:yes gene_type:complete